MMTKRTLSALARLASASEPAGSSIHRYRGYVPIRVGPLTELIARRDGHASTDRARCPSQTGGAPEMLVLLAPVGVPAWMPVRCEL